MNMAMRFNMGSVFLFLLLCGCGSAFAQASRSSIEIVKPKDYSPLNLSEDRSLQEALDGAVEYAIASNEKLKAEDIAATVIDITDARSAKWASVRGEAQIYPASVVKMYYMAALERQLQDGKITMTPELQRGLRDMIVDSSNEATQYILDVLTDTASGGEKPQKEFEQWQYQRNRVNRWLISMGYTNVNANQKTFCEDAYGIEQQSRRYKGENRNMLTTNATARIMAEIVTGRLNTPERTASMLKLMERDPFTGEDKEDQAHGFAGQALIEMDLKDAKLWSKAGWTSRTRHDAAYIELANGAKFVIVVFTERNSANKAPIKNVTQKMIEHFMSTTN